MTTNLPAKRCSAKIDPAALKRVLPNSVTHCADVGLPGIQFSVTSISGTLELVLVNIKMIRIRLLPAKSTQMHRRDRHMSNIFAWDTK